MELTIKELAAQVGMTPRNIREWQTIGVLHAPLRRGRVAYYDDHHVARIERVKSLRADGFPLDVIRQYVERSEETAADVQSLASIVLDPATPGPTKAISRTELAERLGAAAEAHLAQAGLIDVGDGDQALIKDVATFDYVEKLVGIGLPIDAVAPALESMLQSQIVGVSALVQLYVEVVWQPFLDAGLPAAQWSSFAVTSGQMRELVLGLGGQMLRRATDTVIGEIAVQQATKLDSRG